MTAVARARRAPAAAGYRLRDAAAMEWVKLRTLRSARWSGLLLTAALVGVGAAVLSYYPGHWSQLSAAGRAQFDPVNAGFTGMAIGQLVIGIAGVLVMTGEYSSGSIRSTLAAIPRRPLLMAAKALVFGAAALIAGEAACLIAFAAGQYLVLAPPAAHASLGDPAAVRAIVMTGAYVPLVGLIGLGLGALIRHTAGAIAAVAGLVFVLPALFSALPEGVRYGPGEYLPMVIAENSISAIRPEPHALAPWPGMLVLGLWAAIALAAGCWRLTRHDA